MEEIKRRIIDFGQLMASSEPVRTIEDHMAYEKAIKQLYKDLLSLFSKLVDEAIGEREGEEPGQWPTEQQKQRNFLRTQQRANLKKLLGEGVKEYGK